MKIKSLLLFIIMSFIILLVPTTVLAANKVQDYTDFAGNEYELFDDNTARVTMIEKGNDGIYGVASTIHGEVTGSDGENYKVISISANALDNITEKQDLYIYPTIAPVLETTNSEEFFKNINAIYVPLTISYTPEFNAQGYTEENGWPKNKTKNYIITEQPKVSTEVTAGEITDNDKLSVRFTMPVAAGSLQYAWYYCDKDGNILNEDDCISNEPDLQIPMDLTYDNENNAFKDYYFRCIVGDPVNIQEYSNVAKVTVKPGTYKVTFHYGSVSEKQPIILAVNNERKLNNTDISKIPTETMLEKYKEGAIFVGWTADYGNTIFNTDDLLTMVFDKNMQLHPLWKTKINIDANGGKFADGSAIFTTYISNYGTFDKEPTEPTREGDEIMGLSYKRTGGNFYEGETLTEETTLYVQWRYYKAEENDSNIDNNINNENDVTVDKSEKDETPKTGNNLQIRNNILLIGLVLIVAITKFIRK